MDWIVAVLLALIVVAMFVMGQQLKAINALLIDIANGIDALVKRNEHPEPDDD